MACGLAALAARPALAWGEDLPDCPGQERWTFALAATATAPLPDSADGRALPGWCTAIGAAFAVTPVVVTVASSLCIASILAYNDPAIPPNDYVVVPVRALEGIRRRYAFSGSVIQGILAHEFWHLEQWRRGATIAMREELEADAAAGYFLGLRKREEDFNDAAVIRWLSVRTDGRGTDHGTARQRERSLHWGFEYGYVEGRQSLDRLRPVLARIAAAA